jgi:polar amino acid transport system substrate-binding protein
MWWAGATLATQAEQMPRHWIARVLAILWMFVGVVFVAYYTAQLTASLTVQQIRGAIAGPDDLPGKRVATTRNSTAAAYLRTQKADVTEVAEIGAAYQLLLDKKVEAVVFDAPVLSYYASHDGKGKVDLVGPVFRKEAFGIVFPLDSPLRKEVDRALLDLRENGTYQKLAETWFGTP